MDRLDNMTTIANAAVFFGGTCLYFFIIYALYYHRNKTFLSTDEKPEIQPLSDLKIYGDGSKLTFVYSGIYRRC